MLKKLLILTTLISAQSLAAVPSQFIAKQYTEALGRAPEPAAWQAAINYFTSTQCTQSALQGTAVNIFQSTEYTSKGYTAQESVLTMYRAILSREPDPSGFNFYKNYLLSGHTAAEVVVLLTSSQEFAGMVPRICEGNAYNSVNVNPEGKPDAPMDIDSGTWTQAQLESCIANNAICSIPPRTVVHLTSTLNIPAGKVVETQTRPDRRMYARQARLVRASYSPSILVVMQRGSTLRNVWLDGGRNRFKDELPKGPSNGQVSVFPNITYVGGDFGTIESVRSDAPLAGTHIGTAPVPMPTAPTSPTAFNGIVAITNNLTTGYAHSHYIDGNRIPWSDGISNHIMSAAIYDNHIVDPTDVGIVLFGHDGATQSSRVWNNTIVHAGHSSYGSLGLDALECLYSLPASCKFSGDGIYNNTILAGKNQHVDIMLYNGTAPWVQPVNPGMNCNSSSNGKCGSGGRIANNTTILGDNNLAIQVQVGLIVDGMLNATTSGNTLNVKPMALPSDLPANINGTLFCAQSDGAMIVNAQPDHAGGTLQAGKLGHTDSCIGHPEKPQFRKK